MQMESNWKSFGKLASAVLVALTLSAISQAQEVSNHKNSSIRIKNLGQMDARFYRGARPKVEDIKELAALGINTVVDLTEDPKPDEKATVESLGMKYVNIPMKGMTTPSRTTGRHARCLPSTRTSLASTTSAGPRTASHVRYAKPIVAPQ